VQWVPGGWEPDGRERLRSPVAEWATDGVQRTLVHAQGCRPEKNKPMCRDTHHLYNRPALSVSTVTVTHLSVGARVVQGLVLLTALTVQPTRDRPRNPPSGCRTRTPGRCVRLDVSCVVVVIA